MREKKSAVELTIKPDGLKIRAERGQLLSDVLEGAKFSLNYYCSRRGLCGKCAVYVSAEDLDSGTDVSQSAKLELACQYRLKGDVSVVIPEQSRQLRVKALETTSEQAVVLNPAVKKYHFEVRRFNLSSLEKNVKSCLSGKAGSDRNKIKFVVDKIRQNKLKDFTLVIYDNEEIISVEAGDSSQQCFGLAVDLGTTSIVIELVDLINGKILARLSSLNPQLAYGADIVSRLAFALLDSNNGARLQKAAVKAIQELAIEASTRTGVDFQKIYEVAIAGNTTMNHFLVGQPINSLAFAPYEAGFTLKPALSAAALGFCFHPDARVYIAPNIASFIGGDISAGLIALDLENHSGNVLFLDLGTNGEIVIKKSGQMIAASAAVGPAFEGMSISCGMLAVSGAVESVDWKDGFVCQTIGGSAARGICGSGLIDVLAVALRHGLIDKNGQILTDDKKIHLSKEIFLNQSDVRKLQLALAAVKTAISILLRELRLQSLEIDFVYVAGAFACNLNISNSKAIGLIPDMPAEKIIFIGNSSLAGARKLLLACGERERASRLSERIVHFPLASYPDFQENFLSYLTLEPLILSDGVRNER